MTKSLRLPWTKTFFCRPCPCGSGRLSYACCWNKDNRWRKEPIGTLSTPIGNHSHTKCYLANYGGCSTDITKEHFVSRNILELLCGTTIIFKKTSDLFAGKPVKKIGIDSFAAKVLCDSHNSMLSPLDEAAGIAFRSVMNLAVEGAVVKPKTAVFHLASGLDIERWMIKVFCGLTAAGKLPGFSNRTDKTDIPPFLLDALLAPSILTPPVGLHAFAHLGQNINPNDISFAPLLAPTQTVSGLMLKMGLFTFAFVSDASFSGQIDGIQACYHHQLIKVDRRDERFGFLLTY